jgi:geranylgeranyl transferase type-2 subunit alpha
MESLVHYKRLLLRNHRERINTEALVRECQGLLSQLEVIDPARRRRYQDLSAPRASLRIIDTSHTSRSSVRG